MDERNQNLGVKQEFNQQKLQEFKIQNSNPQASNEGLNQIIYHS